MPPPPHGGRLGCPASRIGPDGTGAGSIRSSDQQRNLLNEESLKRDWLQARADLASLRVRARQAELDFRRISQLFEREQVSASDFDQARATFEALSAEETERAHLVESLERAVQRVRGPENGNDGLASLMQGTLALQETRLRALEAELLPIRSSPPFPAS